MKKPKISIKIYKAFLYILPAILFFSYYPIIKFGSNESMNFELSLPLIWLVLFDIYSIVLFLKNFKFKKIYEGITDRKFFLLSLFPLYSTISIFWSENPIRGILTSGILWATFLAAFFIIYMTKNLKDLKINIEKFIIVPTIVISAWCILQCILDIAGVSREVTLLCSGCTYKMFGFPHPNGFAIEPQFMGNLLIAPTLYVVYKWLQNGSKKYLALLMFFSVTLFLTFSRGAIYSFGIATIFMIIAKIIKDHNSKSLLLVPVLLFSFLITICAQGLMAELSSTNDTFFSGFSKSLNQLSLGIIDIKEKENVENYEINIEIKKQENIEKKKEESTFDGYVKQSTNVRLDLTKSAITVWKDDPKNILLGVGLGGAGESLYKENLVGSPKEIVQNEFFSILLETGITGIILIIVALLIIIKELAKTNSPILYYSILIAFGISLMFFAGLPNALHIYLMPALLTTQRGKN